MDELVGEDLGEAVLRKQQEQRVIRAQWVLVEKHRVWFLVNFTLTILVVVFLLLHLLLCDDFFIIKINVEQDLSRVFFQ